MSLSQEATLNTEGDLKYREDQFYIGVTYNILTSTPSGLRPDGLTGGISFGFLRDMPINKNRNIAIAAGLGFGIDSYGQNLLIEENGNGKTSFTVLNTDVNYKSNNLRTGIVELPLELRWRSSTPTSYKFWRIYAGVRAGYTFWNKSNYKDSSRSVSISDIEEYEKLRFSTTLSLGFNKFNFFVYYTLTPFFNEDAITSEGEQVKFQTLKLGLIFYIL